MCVIMRIVVHIHVYVCESSRPAEPCKALTRLGLIVCLCVCVEVPPEEGARRLQPQVQRLDVFCPGRDARSLSLSLSLSLFLSLSLSLSH